MQKLLRLASAAVVSTALASTGVAAAQTGGSISDSGPYSHNKINTSNSSHVRVRNHNWTDVDNYNSQYVSSGTAVVSGNTNAGSARTGNANATNATTASVTYRNTNTNATMSGGSGGSGGGGTISDTGPYSTNKINTSNDSHVNIDNHNATEIDNQNCQTVTSGDATVTGNTNGGSASTGNASATNTSTFSVNYTNSN